MDDAGYAHEPDDCEHRPDEHMSAEEEDIEVVKSDFGSKRPIEVE